VLLAWLLAVGAGAFSAGPLFGRLADSRLPAHVESVAVSEIIFQGDDSSGTVVGVVDGIDPTDDRVREDTSTPAASVAR
jgi:RND superfamily putative drug exporter